jgi:hypothetical protein
MCVPRTVAEILSEHVTLEVEGIDRMYLNVYQPKLQIVQGIVNFFHYHRKQPVASSALMRPISHAFVIALERFAEDNHIPLFTFAKNDRKEDVAAKYRANFSDREGVLFIGKAQEKATAFRTEMRLNPKTGKKYPWIVKSTAMVNQFYIYAIDEDFGPFFLKVSSYFPFNAKLCLNGHEYAKRQLAKKGIAFEALDNGVLSCDQPQQLQSICDSLDATKIEAFLRKWLAKLPHPYTAQDRAAGYRYDVSILQAEFSLTQVLDSPRNGRLFFEEVIRDNLHLGRPDGVQLLFNRRISQRTPGRLRTRVLYAGVMPTLHIDYKTSRIKQYHKEGRALRTETTINNPHDFGIGKRLPNLAALRRIGFEANRRLLHVEKVSRDCAIGEAAFRQLNEPIVVEGQRASALRFADTTVQALLCALVMFRLLSRGFSTRELRDHWAPLLGKKPGDMTPGQMTYHLRRLRLHGLIARVEHTHRYRVTDCGLRVAFFSTRIYSYVLRPGLSEMLDDQHQGEFHPALRHLSKAIRNWIEQQKLAA